MVGQPVSHSVRQSVSQSVSRKGWREKGRREREGGWKIGRSAGR